MKKLEVINLVARLSSHIRSEAKIANLEANLSKKPFEVYYSLYSQRSELANFSMWKEYDMKRIEKKRIFSEVNIAKQIWCNPNIREIKLNNSKQHLKCSLKPLLPAYLAYTIFVHGDVYV
jgi:hypothetical protein